jgi:hypothetical protein
MPQTRLTEPLITNIAAAVETGAWPISAAIRNGASRWQAKHWIELGTRLNEAATTDDEATDLTTHEQHCLDLVRRIDIAEAICEAAWLDRWLITGAAARGNGWTAFATLLERRFPARWGKRAPTPTDPNRDTRTLEDMIDDIEREGA